MQKIFDEAEACRRAARCSTVVVRMAFITIWMTLSVITYGAIFAGFQGALNAFPQMQRNLCRQDMGQAALLSLIPVTWVIAPFMTGFYEHGFKWTCEESQ